MGESTATLIAIGITVPIAAFLIYLAVRNMVSRLRDVSDALDGEATRRRQLDAARLRDTESVRSEPSPAAAQLIADLQAQAKRSDDAHKAEIAAHANRELPPVGDAGQEAIERSQKARIAIKHVFPPRLPQRSMSYFGGLPIVPDEFDWPTVHNRQGLLERLNFLAQIDCADLPPGPGRDLLPDRGYLYFFAPLADSFGPDATHFVTRYVPRKVTQKWEPLDMPATSKIEPQDRMEKIIRGARTHFDKVEIEFGWIEEPSDAEVDARTDEGHPHEVAQRIRADKLDSFFGPPVAYDPLLSVQSAPKDRLWIPYEGFPANWQTARLIRRFIESYLREEMTDVDERLEALGDVTDDDEEALRLKKLKTDLSVFSVKMGNALFIDGRLKDFDAPSEEEKQKILEFLEELRVNGMPSSKERHYGHYQLPMALNDWLAYAAVHGAEAGLTDPEAATLIPPEVVSVLAHRHAGRNHQMLGLGEVIQVAADEMKDRYLLLLQLAPDAALNWTIGEMGPLQYWITPEDLAARRFENTILTIEAY